MGVDFLLASPYLVLMTTTNTIIDDNKTIWALVDGLALRGEDQDQVECVECTDWCWPGDKIRHRKHCESRPQLVVAGTDLSGQSKASTSFLTRTKRGKPVVKGPVSEVVLGELTLADGTKVIVESVSRKSWEDRETGEQVHYGYLAEAAAPTSGPVAICSDCGAEYPGMSRGMNWSCCG